MKKNIIFFTQKNILSSILNYKSLILLFSICFFASQISCKKSTILQEDKTFQNDLPNLQLTEKFFQIPINTDPQVLKIIEKIEDLNSKKEFITNFVNKNGFAIWNKAMLGNKNMSSFSNSANNSNDTTIIYIPLVLN